MVVVNGVGKVSEVLWEFVEFEQCMHDLVRKATECVLEVQKYNGYLIREHLRMYHGRL